jgi:hypothetical protein
MSHPVGNSDAVPAAVGPVNSGYGPYGPPPGYPGAPVPPPQQGSLQRPPGRGRLVAAIGATAVVSAVAGGLVGGGLVTARQSDPVEPRPTATAAPPAPTADQVHAADVQLCTSYAISNASMPDPQESALQILPGANALRTALMENPDAAPEIRSAMVDVIGTYDALMASFGKVRTRGYAEPPVYSKDRAQASYDRAWDVCQLGS